MLGNNDLKIESVEIEPNVTIAYVDKSMIKNSIENIFSLLDHKSYYIIQNLPTINASETWKSKIALHGS